MTLSLYLYSISIALLGLLLATLLQMKSQNDKARDGNIIIVPTLWAYIREEWLATTISIVVIAIAILLIPVVLSLKPEWLPYIRPAFLPIGYMGTDIFLKTMGVVSKRVNAALGSKAAQADEANGTVDAPTPAAKISKVN